MSSQAATPRKSPQARAIADSPRPPAAAFPTIASRESAREKEELSSQVESIIGSFLTEEAVSYHAVSVVRENETLFASGQSTIPFLINRSISEIFTCFAILNRLNKQVDISFDDPIQKFFPSFADVDPNGSPHISLREFRGTGNGSKEVRQGSLEAEDEGYKHSLLEQIRSEFRSNMLETEQGLPALDPESPPFPAMGFAFLSQALADSSLPQNIWQDFVQEEFLKDIGMSNTGTNLSNVYSQWRDANLPEITELFDNRSVELAGGGWYSTATDLAKCLIYLLKLDSVIRWDPSSRNWTVSWTILGRSPGRSELGLTWEQEVFTLGSGVEEHVITKGGSLGNFHSFIGLHPRTKLGVSVLLLVNDSATVHPKALGTRILYALIPPISKSVDSHYSGWYICEPAPPIVRKSNNGNNTDTVEVLGGEVQITSSPSLGLQAALSMSLLVNGKRTLRQGQFLLVTSRVPSEGSTSRWRLLDVTNHPELRGEAKETAPSRSPRHQSDRHNLHGITFEFELGEETELNRVHEATPGLVICKRRHQQ